MARILPWEPRAERRARLARIIEETARSREETQALEAIVDDLKPYRRMTKAELLDVIAELLPGFRRLNARITIVEHALGIDRFEEAIDEALIAEYRAERDAT